MAEPGWVQVDGENLKVRAWQGGIQLRAYNAVSGGYLQKWFPWSVSNDLANALIELAKERIDG